MRLEIRLILTLEHAIKGKFALSRTQAFFLSSLNETVNETN